MIEKTSQNDARRRAENASMNLTSHSREDLIQQCETFEIAMSDMAHKLAVARGEIDALHAHREHTRRWLRGELNYDPLDLAPMVCLWCGEQLEGGRPGAREHAVICPENPVVQDRDRLLAMLKDPLPGQGNVTLTELLELRKQYYANTNDRLDRPLVSGSEAAIVAISTAVKSCNVQKHLHPASFAAEDTNIPAPG